MLMSITDSPSMANSPPTLLSLPNELLLQVFRENRPTIWSYFIRNPWPPVPKQSRSPDTPWLVYRSYEQRMRDQAHNITRIRYAAARDQNRLEAWAAYVGRTHPRLAQAVNEVVQIELRDLDRQITRWERQELFCRAQAGMPLHLGRWDNTEG